MLLSCLLLCILVFIGHVAVAHRLSGERGGLHFLGRGTLIEALPRFLRVRHTLGKVLPPAIGLLLGLHPIGLGLLLLRRVGRPLSIGRLIIPGLVPDGGVVHHIGGLIGKHGQTLDSLQYLTNLVANKNTENRVHIVIDVENYRDRRAETLTRLARRLADKVKKSGERIVLEPMNPHERKIIHTALQNDNKITTLSEGSEPFRKVVIELKK